MNKQELIAHFQEQKKVAEREIAFWQAQLDDEPEKPKLRPGDWWLVGKYTIRMFMKEWNDEKRDCVALDDCLITNIGNYYGGEPILGNVFDLLKKRSKPLTEFELDVHKYFIDGRADMSHAPIHIAGNWHTLSEAEEHCHNLGRLIATYKRKEKTNE